MKRRVTREEIIRTTQELITRNGLRTVRVDEIAQKLEISKRTLYELFRDKDTLIEQCWDELREEHRRRVEKIRHCYHSGAALEQIRNLTEEFIAVLCAIDRTSLRDLQDDDAYASSYEKGRRFWLETFTEVLRQGIADGMLLAEVNCDTYAVRLVNILLNLYLEGCSRPEMNAVGWVVLRGISTREGIEWFDRTRRDRRSEERTEPAGHTSRKKHAGKAPA